jgi:outer membrane protein OmpA-like peptidoglycan-associated protein
MKARSFGSWSPRVLVAATALLGAVSMAAPEAHAQSAELPLQQGSFDLRVFRPAVDSKGLVTVNGTDILGAGNFSFGLLLDVGTSMARIGRGGASLVDSMFTGIFHFNLGIGDVVVVGAQLPFHLVSGPGSASDVGGMAGPGLSVSQYNPGSNLNYQGLGDIVLHAKLRWLRGEYWPVGLAVLLQVGIPVMGGTGFGSGNRSFAGEPGPWVWPSVAVERRITRAFRIAGNLGFRLPFGDTAQLTPINVQNAAAISYGPSLTYGFGASYRLGTVVDLMAEFYGAQYVNGFGNALSTTPMEAVAGAKIFVDRNSYLFLGGGAGLTPALASSGFRGFVGFIFEPTVGDTDGDGYRDDVDRCPTDPEDFDNFEDEEGCPEPDNDRDGILDTDDQCPLVPEDRNGQQDTDGCPDSDVADRDGDQIADNVDQCPDDPEDRDSFEDQNGCPDPDNDQDQILDTDDLCPNDPEDRDNFEDDNGCPDPDNDQDGILDAADHSAGGQDCRNDPEVFNGLEDEDGCPDQGRIRVIGTVVDLDPILFETDSAQIVDNAGNREILDELAQLLASRPDIEQLEVEGHTDERAPDDHNLQLSRERANSVVAALVTRNVARGRLVPAGYGEYCPVDPRSNAEAWARNRRVSCLITRLAIVGRTRQSAGCPRGRQYVPAEVGPPNPNAPVDSTSSARQNRAAAAPAATPAPAAPAPAAPAPAANKRN